MSVKHHTKENTAMVEMQNQSFNPKLVGRSKKSCHFLACGCDAAAEAYRQPSDRNLVDQSANRNKLVSAVMHILTTKRIIVVKASSELTDGESLRGNEVANRGLEVLNSNKELFMKLLQDPNSLLVKHIQNLRDSQSKKQPQSSSKARISQCQPKEAGEYEVSANAPVSV
ncbi:hypothetical protein PTKIN_Ptkin05aG0056200 [Pterospermum kingtungense]